MAMTLAWGRDAALVSELLARAFPPLRVQLLDPLLLVQLPLMAQLLAREVALALRLIGRLTMRMGRLGFVTRSSTSLLLGFLSRSTPRLAAPALSWR